MINWYLICAYALVVSFILSTVLTWVARKMALRWQIMDHPGERKMQDTPMPLLGGVAICVTFFAIIGIHLLMLSPLRAMGNVWIEKNVLDFLGSDVRWKLAGLTAGGIIIFVVGLIDDIKTLTPEKKLAGEILAALAVVLCGVRLDVFNPHIILSCTVTVVWILMMINAINFLDNMDGLSAGISLIAALGFFACVLPMHQTFVAVLLMVFAGSVAGFLYHNFSPARIYMGDAGALCCGYILATVSVLSTYYYADNGPISSALAAPFVALSVPIFDIISVVYIRWRNGESIMRGDKRHFSHRLVQLGMTPRQAVEFIYLVGAVTALGAALLPRVDLYGTVIILAQCLGVFLLIVLLMNAGNHRAPDK